VLVHVLPSGLGVGRKPPLAFITSTLLVFEGPDSGAHLRNRGSGVRKGQICAFECAALRRGRPTA
jgi:hypothetical protein